MTRLLLDTNVLLWAQADGLDPETKSAVTQAAAVFVSAATIWEIEIKRSLGKLRAPDDPAALIDEAGFDRLSIDFDHATEAGRLPLHHGDPFDRMLVAQARCERLTLVTGDPRLARYDVPVLAAAPA